MSDVYNQEEIDDNRRSPWASPLEATWAVTPSDERRHSGLRRLPFLLIMLAMPVGILFLIIAGFFLPPQLTAPLVIVAFLVSLICFCVSLMKRLENADFHPSTAVVFFIPGLNLIVMIACLICQEGFMIDRRLDQSGAAGFIVLCLLMVAAVIGWTYLLFL